MKDYRRVYVHIVNTSLEEPKRPFNWYRALTNLLSMLVIAGLVALMVMALSN